MKSRLGLCLTGLWVEVPGAGVIACYFHSTVSNVAQLMFYVALKELFRDN